MSVNLELRCGNQNAQVSGEGEDKYLIATSEQTLCSMLRKTWISPKDLPQRYRPNPPGLTQPA